MAELHVELVSADRRVWSGTASMVVARTPDGEMGVLPGHTPVLGVLVGGEIRINATAAESVAAQVDGGFISVDHDRVTLVAERVTIGQAATARSSAP